MSEILEVLIADLAKSGLEPILLGRVAAALSGKLHATKAEAQAEKRRASGAERQARYRERNGVTKRHSDVTVTQGVPEVPEVPKEYISNPPNLLTSPNPPAAAATAGKYAFAGQVIKLTPKDFSDFRQEFSRIVDLGAELRDADAFYVDTPPKDGKWWFALRGWLKKANQAAVLPSRPIQKPASGPTFDEVGRMTSW